MCVFCSLTELVGKCRSDLYKNLIKSLDILQQVVKCMKDDSDAELLTQFGHLLTICTTLSVSIDIDAIDVFLRLFELNSVPFPIVQTFLKTLDATLSRIEMGRGRRLVCDRILSSNVFTSIHEHGKQFLPPNEASWSGWWLFVVRLLDACVFAPRASTFSTSHTTTLFMQHFAFIHQLSSIVEWWGEVEEVAPQFLWHQSALMRIVMNCSSFSKDLCVLISESKPLVAFVLTHSLPCDQLELQTFAVICLINLHDHCHGHENFFAATSHSWHLPYLSAFHKHREIIGSLPASMQPIHDSDASTQEENILLEKHLLYSTYLAFLLGSVHLASLCPLIETSIDAILTVLTGFVKIISLVEEPDDGGESAAFHTLIHHLSNARVF